MGLLGVGRVNYDNRDGCVSVSALSIAGMYLRQTKPLVEVERFVSGHGFQPCVPRQSTVIAVLKALRHPKSLRHPRPYVAILARPCIPSLRMTD